MMMFGMGGTLVEQLKDISFRVAPLSAEDINEMVDSTIAGKLLKGVRGSTLADIEAVQAVIAALSQLALDFRKLKRLKLTRWWCIRRAGCPGAGQPHGFAASLMK
jgi:acyl-CoA synthetase (NDP forming)